MAKGGLQSKGKKDPSKHSRAARRATSPSINTDKSLKDVKPPSESLNYRPAVLAAHSGAGISKSKRSGRKAILSSKARRRQEKNLDRAEAIIDRTTQKIQRSKGQARNTQSRKKAWDEINNQIPGTKSSNMFAGLEDGDDYEDTDEEMDGDEQAQPLEADGSATAPAPVTPNEDEIL